MHNIDKMYIAIIHGHDNYVSGFRLLEMYMSLFFKFLFQFLVQPIKFLTTHGCFARRNEVETVASRLLHAVV